jgi:hypothetical protein
MRAPLTPNAAYPPSLFIPARCITFIYMVALFWEFDFAFWQNCWLLKSYSFLITGK